MDALLADVYQTYGLRGVFLLTVGFTLVGGVSVTFVLLRAYANRQNADSQMTTAQSRAVEHAVVSARESQTDLRVQFEAYKLLRAELDMIEKDRDRLQLELSTCNETMTAAAYEQASCQTQVIRLQQELQTLRAEYARLKHNGE